jgi:hypothetical protein
VSNRFTDTEKYSDEWYWKLDCQHQRMWDYILLRCNHAGIWKVNRSEAEHHLRNNALPWDTFLEAMKGRVEVIDGGTRWFVPKFVKFQYPTGLKEKSSVHKGVIKALRISGVLGRILSLYGEAFVSLLNPSEGFGRIKDKNQNQDKNQDQEKSEGETEREEVFEDLFAGASLPKPPKPVVPIGPHEALAFVRGKSVKAFPSDGVGWARLINKYGIDEIDAALESAPAESKKDFNVCEGYLQARRKRRKEATRLNEAQERSLAKEAEEKSAREEQKRKDEASREPSNHISEYLCDPNTPDEVRERMGESASVRAILKAVKDGKYTAMNLEAALIRFKELRPIAYPDEVKAS